ncbi:VIT1/CCC1 transporter family protein [Streptomyces sp. NPDC055134]
MISTAGLDVAGAGAATNPNTLILTGLSGLLAGSLSMAAGEYISVSTQRDAQQVVLDREACALHNKPDDELEERRCSPSSCRPPRPGYRSQWCRSCWHSSSRDSPAHG